MALFEKELKTDFLRENLHYLQVNLPRLLTENLEMSHSLEMDIEKDMIRIRIEGSVYRESKSDEQRDIYFSFGSPLTNAIACILSKVTGKKVTEVKRLSSPNGDDTIIEYRILEDEE